MTPSQWATEALGRTAAPALTAEQILAGGSWSHEDIAAAAKIAVKPTIANDDMAAFCA